MKAGIDLHSNAEFIRIKEDWQRTAEQPNKTRPIVTVCVAQSLDGCITVKKNRQTQLSGSKSNFLTHLLRSWNDAILVGANTVSIDNPRLTVRAFDAPQPQRVLLDSKLRISLDSHLLTDSHEKPWVFSSKNFDSRKKASLEACGSRVFPTRCHNGYLRLDDCLQKLYSLGVRHLMVELEFNKKMQN
ncbi:MAG: RibD family protein [Oligoflexales bacterium]|nr:RibD family protein [Oligoflexales bacterium]